MPLKKQSRHQLCEFININYKLEMANNYMGNDDEEAQILDIHHGIKHYTHGM